MHSGYSVDLDALRGLTAKLRGYQEFLSTHLGELEQQVQNLSSGWAGVAADAYTHAHRDWTVAVQDVRDGLAALERTVARAAESYAAATEANRKMVGRKR